MKRQPLLADLALAADVFRPTYVNSRWRQQTLDWLRMAKRFVLDEEAAVYLGRMIRENPRVIADAQDFAIPPYQTMWIELPAIAFYNSVTGEPSPDPRVDQQIGYVFRDGVVRSIARGFMNFEDKPDVCVLPLEYRLHSPMTDAQQEAVAEVLKVSRLGLDFWFWGSSAKSYMPALANSHDDRHDWDRAGLRALRDNHSVRLAPLIGDGADPVFARIAAASAGDLRNIVALLLFLNRTASITVQDGRPMGEGFIRGKLRPLLSHSVIRLRLDPMPRLTTLSAGLGVKRRLHDVRGHFCHDRVAREHGCPHGQEHEGDFGEWWEEFDVLHWNCTGCGGKRWWRAEHKRGQAPGEVVQSYQVTK